MNDDRQTFTIQYVILAKPTYWREIKRGQKFALNIYAFSQERDRFEVYCKRTWGRCFLETHPNKIDYPIYKLVNPLRNQLYLVLEEYTFNN